MNIFEVPFDVLCYVFDRVPTKDILQFREAGPRFREVVNEYKPEMNKRLKLTYRSLIGRSDLQNCVQDPDHFASPAISLEGIDADAHSLMQLYGRRFGDSVERLKMELFHIQQTRVEKGFFETLINLRDLWIDDIKHCSNFYSVFSGKSVEECSLPANIFGEIKKLKFVRASDPFLVHFLLQSCPKIKYLSYGIVAIPEEPARKMERDMRIINDISSFLDSKQPGPLIIDYAYFDYDAAGANTITRFIRTVALHDVTILGFPASTLELIASGFYRWLNANELTSFLNCVHGVKGLAAGLCMRRLPNLKQIIAVHITENNLAYFEQNYPTAQVENWPNLKKLDVWIDIERSQLYSLELNSGRILRGILTFMLNTTSNVADLKIRVSGRRIMSYLEPNIWTQHFINLERLDLDIGSYCTEVLSLFLELGRNTRIKYLKLTLWDEHVNGNMFIGPDRQHPAFLAMTALKHFHIRIMTASSQPNYPLLPDALELANTLYALVLSQARLTCLLLQAVSNWNFPVTTSALNSLLAGPIGNVLRYFEFSHSYFQPNEQGDFDAAFSRIQHKISLNRMMQISSLKENGECAKCFYL